MSLGAPLETLKLRRGVCEDYAVLLVTALLYANASPVYLLAFNSYDHVAAAAMVGKAVFVLDQHLPPIEVQDYVQYILAGNPGEVEAYEAKLVDGRVVLERRFVEAFIDRDSFPEDKLPPDIALDVARALAELHPNLEVEPRLQCFTETRLGPLWIIKEPKTRLEGLQPTGIFKLYSPLFRDQWVRFLAKLISWELGDQLAVNKYIWVQVTGDELAVALTPYKPPEVEVKRQGSVVVVYVRSSEPISTISILCYKDNATNPILGVAPRNARYPGIKTIHAQEYTVSGATAHIEFNAIEVNSSLPPGSYVLAVWVNSKLAYTCSWETP